MLKIALVVKNLREASILNRFFLEKKIGVKLIQFESHVTLQNFNPDILVLEIPLDYGDYLKYLYTIRHDHNTQGLPIIAFGNHNNIEDIKEFIKAGINKYLTRPLRINALVQSIAKCLQITGSPESNEQAHTVVKKTPEEKKRAKVLKSLLSTDVSKMEKINMMIDNIGTMSAYPHSIAKIVETTDSNSSSAKDLAEIIKRDQSLSTKIINTANTINYYGQNQVKDVVDAVVRIGFDETKKISLGLLTMKIVDKDDKSFAFHREEYWYHCMACAIISDKLAREVKYPNASFAFLCGLLHELGVLLYDEFFPEAFDMILEKAYNEYLDINEAGRSVLGIHHSEFMKELLGKWAMPKDLILISSHHKNFLSLRGKVDSTVKKLIVIVGVADVLAKAARIGRSCDEFIYDIPMDIIREAGITSTFDDNFFDSVYKDIRKTCKIMGMNERTFPQPANLFNQHKEPVKIGLFHTPNKAFEPHIFHLKHNGYALTELNPEGNLGEQIAKTKPDLLIYDTSKIDPNTDFAINKPGQEKKFIPKVVLFEDDLDMDMLEENDHLHKHLKGIDLRKILTSIEVLVNKK